MRGDPVVIVGGGIVGTCVAWSLATAGADVTVVSDDPAGGAWRVAAGMLAPTLEAAPGEDGLRRLTTASARAWPDFASALTDASGDEVGFEPAGSLLVARDGDDLAALRDVLALQRDLGLDVEPRSVADARSAEPHLSPRIRGAIAVPGDHRVDPRCVVTAAVTAGERAGVTRLDGEVARLDHDGHRVHGVTLVDGRRVPAATVVLAAGAASADLAGVPERDRPPVRPVKGQLLVLRSPDGAPVLGVTVRALVHGRSVYLVPRADGRLVVGATEEDRGPDRTVTAGAVRQLLDDAVAVLPVVDEHELVEALVGLRPGTPDGSPVIGRAELDGLVLATGHHRHGVLLAPITATAVTAIVTGQPVPAVLAAADPARFRTETTCR